MPHYCRLLLLGIFNWTVWLLMVVLVVAQLLGAVWDSSTVYRDLFFGRSLAEPLSPLSGSNDEPYADRAIVCMAQGRTYLPSQLSVVLADAKMTTKVPSSDRGFRVVQRNGMTLNAYAYDLYARACDRIDYSLDAIQNSCDALGFRVTRDTLRIVTDDIAQDIPKALPILLVPFADNAAHVYYVIPGEDGAACIFRLNGMYQSEDMSFGLFRGAPRANREAKTIEWLKKPGGQWRNGWYEDLDGQKWFSNMITSMNGGPYGLAVRQFDTVADKEVECNTSDISKLCTSGLIVESWGSRFTTISEFLRQDQVVVTNGSRFGLFMFDARVKSTIASAYSLDTLISNVSTLTVLLRWFVSLAAMELSFWRGVASWQTTGIGALSGSPAFNLMPLVLLPKLKTTLCVFFSVGCFFEGQQHVFTDAWFIMYPGIVEFVLYYYSLLNIVAKASYRRMSDAFFGPTLVLLCLLHHFSGLTSAAKWFGIDSRLSTLVFSTEVDKLSLSDFFTTNVALRINGNAAPLFYFKLGILVANLLPLLLAEKMTKCRRFPACEIEQTLVLRASNVGGLGRSAVYRPRQQRQPKALGPELARTSLVPLIPRPSRVMIHPKQVRPRNQQEVQQTCKFDHVLLGYELSRLSYLVFGGKYLISYDDWYILTSLAPLRFIEKLWNYRITVFDVVDGGDASMRVVGTPQLCRLDDLRLRKIPFYDVTVCDFQ